MSFKVGDWVRSKGRVYQIASIVEDSLYDDTPNWIGDIPDIEKWKPREDEWCWMWSDGNLSPHIMQFSCMGRDGKTFMSGWAGYDECEPFIGKLPTFITEKI